MRRIPWLQVVRDNSNQNEKITAEKVESQNRTIIIVDRAL
jgi:hypothetical protein